MSNGQREWVRLDCGIGTHDKILELLARKRGADAFVTYVSALGWCGAHGREGHVPRHALHVNHGTEALAGLLVDVGLWDRTPAGDGWIVRNWHLRQESNEQLEAAKDRRRRQAATAACRRWHGPDCRCAADPP